MPDATRRVDLRGFAPVFAALGDATRLRLVTRLSGGEAMSIKSLCAGTGVTRQAVTKHLQVLETAGVVRGFRHGREQLWELEMRRLTLARSSLERMEREWRAALGRLARFVENG